MSKAKRKLKKYEFRTCAKGHAQKQFYQTKPRPHMWGEEPIRSELLNKPWIISVSWIHSANIALENRYLQINLVKVDALCFCLRHYFPQDPDFRTVCWTNIVAVRYVYPVDPLVIDTTSRIEGGGSVDDRLWTLNIKLFEGFHSQGDPYNCVMSGRSATVMCPFPFNFLT